MERILITGSDGQLGSELVRVLSADYRIVTADIAEMDITDAEAVRRFILEHKPDCIIHAAAFTGVDDCESMQEEAFRVNGQGTKNVAVAAGEAGARLFFISTDYVFDGLKETPYLEDDDTNPINVYGASKLLGERFVKEEAERFFIIRTAWLYGFEGNNFVKTILKLAAEKDKLEVVDDQRGSPTFALDVARQIALRPGLYHGLQERGGQSLALS